MEGPVATGIDYHLGPLLVGVTMALTLEWLLRFREVSVSIAIVVVAVASWTLFAPIAPGFADLLEVMVDQVEAAATSGFLIGLTIGNQGTSLLRSLRRNLSSTPPGRYGRSNAPRQRRTR